MKLRISVIILLVLGISLGCLAPVSNAADLGGQVLTGAAIGMLVHSTAPQLNKFINSVTLQKSPIGMATKVVPILSVGEKAYVGAAQVAGPQAEVNSTQAVWLYEDNFSNNEFRIKVLVPTNSINPLHMKKVQKVGLSAVIDVSLDGRWHGESVSKGIGLGDILKTGVVALAVSAAADPINKAINSITQGIPANTKVVPILTVGSKAYIGGVQISGPVASIKQAKSVFQYEGLFSDGRFRIKAFVPCNSVNPTSIKRLQGLGITALIDVSIADQRSVQQRQVYWRKDTRHYPSLQDAWRGKRSYYDEHEDNGWHKGWYIGKGNQKKSEPDLILKPKIDKDKKDGVLIEIKKDSDKDKKHAQDEQKHAKSHAEKNNAKHRK